MPYPWSPSILAGFSLRSGMDEPELYSKQPTISSLTCIMHESARALSPEGGVPPALVSLGAVVTEKRGPNRVGGRRGSNLLPSPRGKHREKTRKRPRSWRENPISTVLPETMLAVRELHGIRVCGTILAVLTTTPGAAVDAVTFCRMEASTFSLGAAAAGSTPGDLIGGSLGAAEQSARRRPYLPPGPSFASPLCRCLEG